MEQKNSIFEYLINFVYPRKCGFCKRICKSYICKKCENKLGKYRLDRVTDVYGKEFKRHAYLFKYENVVRRKLLSYKFYYRGYLYRSFVQAITQSKNCANFFREYDVIIPVPLHLKRRMQRGYNQSELIAKALAKYYNLTYVGNVLYKIRNIKPQSTLNQKERKSNIIGVYRARNVKKITGKKVILLDDVYTSGSTLQECCKTLKQKGVENIDIFTLIKSSTK